MAPIRRLITRIDRNAWSTYQTGRKFVKTLKAGSLFTITNSVYYNGALWVRSGLGDWYSYADALFSCHCLNSAGVPYCGGRANSSRVMVYPAKPQGALPGESQVFKSWDLVAWKAHYIVDAGLSHWSAPHNWGDARRINRPGLPGGV